MWALAALTADLAEGVHIRRRYLEEQARGFQHAARLSKASIRIRADRTRAPSRRAALAAAKAEAVSARLPDALVIADPRPPKRIERGARNGLPSASDHN